MNCIKWVKLNSEYLAKSCSSRSSPKHSLQASDILDGSPQHIHLAQSPLTSDFKKVLARQHAPQFFETLVDASHPLTFPLVAPPHSRVQLGCQSKRVQGAAEHLILGQRNFVFRPEGVAGRWGRRRRPVLARARLEVRPEEVQVRQRAVLAVHAAPKPSGECDRHGKITHRSKPAADTCVRIDLCILSSLVARGAEIQSNRTLTINFLSKKAATEFSL